MFVQSAITTNHKHKNGVAIKQRRGHRETLVQWQNGARRWVETTELQGTVRLIGGLDSDSDYDSEGEY